MSTALAKFRQSRLLCPNCHGFTNFANSTKFSIELRQRCHFRYCLHLWTYLQSCLEAIKNAGDASRRFLAASPLRALALKMLKILLKPQRYAGLREGGSCCLPRDIIIVFNCYVSVTETLWLI